KSSETSVSLFMRMSASVHRVLPPRSSRTARSSTPTWAPACMALAAAERPAMPLPTTSTSKFSNRCICRAPIYEQSGFMSSRSCLRGYSELSLFDFLGRRMMMRLPLVQMAAAVQRPVSLHDEIGEGSRPGDEEEAVQCLDAGDEAQRARRVIV